MELSPRLLKIASLVPKGARLADVGTDHGYVPLYLLENNIITRAIAMDINPMPLKRAEDNIKGAGYGDNCDFRLSDGLCNLKRGECDAIVIAGMGGILMIEILQKSLDRIDADTRLFLQPMLAPIELREYLFSNGFVIENEYVVREENKFYNIICAKRGDGESTDADIYIGKNLRQNSPEVYDDYIKYRINICKKIINGIQSSKNVDNDALQKRQKEYSVYLADKQGEIYV